MPMLRPVHALLCCLAVLAMAPAGGTIAAQEPNAETVLAREKQRVAALVAGDFDRLAGMLSPTMTYTHSSGAVDSKEAYLATLRSGRVVYRQVNHSDVQVRFVTPGVAVLTGRSDVVVTVAGKDDQVPLQFTIVYVERGGEWMFEAWHSVRRAAQ